ncbi:MAG: class I SAM-dependent methyltransferase [Ilumatobacteraceae bacterium]
MLLLGMNGEQYFERTPRSAESGKSLDWIVDGRELQVDTAGGVFSRRGLDDGTRFLIERVSSPPEHGAALDLGCGWGALAIALAVRSPNLRVWAVDVNERAVALTTANARRNGIDNVTAVLANDVPSDVLFDVIWSNPPIRIGKRQLHELLHTWLQRLAPRGVAWLVVSRHLGADSLADWLVAEGWKVERVGSRHGYRILKVDRASPGDA